MKRLSICITALAAAIALAGCQKQAPVELPSTYEFELRATAGDPATKTYYEKGDIGYVAVTPASGDNPYSKGWYTIA